MSAIATRHKLIKKIKDEKFDEEKLHRYTLLAQIGAKDFQTAVIDSEDDRLIFFEDYVLSDINSSDDLTHALKALFESHENLMAGFWKEVKLSIKNSKFAQVPAALFLPEAANEYLALNASLDPARESVRHCANRKTDAVTVFGISNDLLEFLNRTYANTRMSLFHQSAALIEGVLTSPTRPGQPLFVYVDRFKLHILWINQGKLAYYNQFLIKQFSDYARSIMLVLAALGLNQETTPVVLWGYIGKNSPHYQEFIKYIRNVTFGERPGYLKFGYLFDEVQEHHFFDLFSLHRLST